MVIYAIMLWYPHHTKLVLSTFITMFWMDSHRIWNVLSRFLPYINKVEVVAITNSLFKNFMGSLDREGAPELWACSKFILSNCLVYIWMDRQLTSTEKGILHTRLLHFKSTRDVLWCGAVGHKFQFTNRPGLPLAHSPCLVKNQVEPHYVLPCSYFMPN